MARRYDVRPSMISRFIGLILCSTQLTNHHNRQIFAAPGRRRKRRDRLPPMFHQGDQEPNSRIWLRVVMAIHPQPHCVRVRTKRGRTASYT
jgi:hypothetical protein